MYEVYDLECLKNLFTYTGYDYTQNKWSQYIICPWKNQYKDLIQHLRGVQLQIGYNNLSYDYPLEHFLITNYTTFKLWESGELLAMALYDESQRIITSEFSRINEKESFIKQIDLYKMWHYDNKAKHTSLKDLEFAMRMNDIEDMPIHHSTQCKRGDEELILSYNKNDVLATYEFLKITLGKTDNVLYKGKSKIELRESLNKKFGINCINYPDVRIGESIICNLYAKAVDKPESEIRKSEGTKRDEIALKDCIPHWTKFESKEFNELKSKFESTIVNGEDLKDSIEFSCVYNNFKINYGLGGAHGCIDSGIYESNDSYIILDEDVGSLYPSIAVQLSLYPEQLGRLFCNIYDKNIVSVRLAEKKKPKEQRNNVIMEGFKLAANSIYGKSNEQSSFLYDPLYTLKTTIGGQMFISMWVEKLFIAIPDIKFLQVNTDGITYLLPRNCVEKAKSIAQEMTDLTGLYIEDNTYKKMVIRDVNNYLAIYDDSTEENEHVKLKGCFEIDKELHKDNSMRIVPIALKEYFVNNTPIKDTIMNHNDIFDFCIRLKTNSLSTAKLDYLEDNKICTKNLSRTTRYYVSNSGWSLRKVFGDGKVVRVNQGCSVTMFNKYVKKNISDYDINYNFYIGEALKIKNTVDTGQLLLF